MTHFPGKAVAGGLLAAALASACAPLPPTRERPPRPEASYPAQRPHDTRPAPPPVSRTPERDTAREPVREAPPRERGARGPGGHEQALREGIALYHEGSYDAAIARLAAADVPAANYRDRLEALKYTAFSHCLSRRESACRATFERALRLDARFDLGPGEHGHPMWAPAFSQAREAVRGARR